MSYDDVWSTFLNFYKSEQINIPTSQEEIYDCIRNAMLLYNNRMRTKCICDDTSETISDLSKDDDKLLVAQYIKLICLQNDYVYYETLMQTFAADVGIRNYNTQLNALKYSVEKQEYYIDNFIFNTLEDFL